jgi:translation initiation factor 2 subunit 1
MLYAKYGLPQEGELVVCTVTKIQNHSVFVNLDFYHKSAMLHISEVSPGRIRNLRDFVSEGKVIVCKVLSINADKGHVDVSLRRVSENQRIHLMSRIKQEVKAEKILESVCEDKKLELKQYYATVYKEISKNYEFLFEAFNDFVKGEYTLPALPEQAYLEDLIKQRVKPPQVELTGKFKIVSFANDGVIQLRNVLKQAQDVDTTNLVITYNGGGNYDFRIQSENFKGAEEILKQARDIIETAFMNKKDALYELVKNEGKQLS